MAIAHVRANSCRSRHNTLPCKLCHALDLPKAMSFPYTICSSCRHEISAILQSAADPAACWSICLIEKRSESGESEGVGAPAGGGAHNYVLCSTLKCWQRGRPEPPRACRPGPPPFDPFPAGPAAPDHLPLTPFLAGPAAPDPRPSTPSRPDARSSGTDGSRAVKAK